MVGGLKRQVGEETLLEPHGWNEHTRSELQFLVVSS